MRQRPVPDMSAAMVAVMAVTLYAVLLFMTPMSRAHDGGTTGFAAITIERNTVRYELTVSSMPANSSADSLATAIATRLQLTNDGVACVAGPRQSMPAKRDVVSVKARVDFVCAASIRQLTIRDNLFDVLGEDVHTLAKIEWAGGSQQFAFGPDAREAVVAIATVTSGDADAHTRDASAARGAGSFFLLGIEHILTGYDHLLFLLALILCARGLLQILKIVTAFTIAHSVTLALAALDVVVFPSQWVEALIALSIAYVAAENLWPRFALSRRWTISFIFGAVHGFGFASILRDAGLEHENLLWPLLNFNLGVEVGQAAVVLVVLPFLIYAREKAWQGTFNRGVSIAILIVGLSLFTERVLF